MSKPIRLTDLQRILLIHAARHPGASTHPLPEAALVDDARTDADLASLLRRELLARAAGTDAASSWRLEEGQEIALVVTTKGLTAIGIEEDKEKEALDATPARSDAAPSPRPSKQAAVVALMRRDGGATLGEIMAATGWLAHSTRAVLTGLRKKGHAIARGKRGDVTCYRVTEVA